jgi:hypothetical protein
MVGCKNADSGNYVPEAGATQQLRCPSGEIQELTGQAECKKPERPLWLTFLMFVVPAVFGGGLAISYLVNRKKKQGRTRSKAYMYSEDMRK